MRFITSMLQPLRIMKFSTISNRILSVLLASLASIATGFAETRPMNPKEHVETYDMPPAYIFRLESSPRMISQLWSVHKLPGEC